MTAAITARSCVSRPVKGRLCTIIRILALLPPAYKIGENVSIFYKSENPEKAIIDGEGGILRIVFMGVGGVILLAGIALFGYNLYNSYLIKSGPPKINSGSLLIDNYFFPGRLSFIVLEIASIVIAFSDENTSVNKALVSLSSFEYLVRMLLMSLILSFGPIVFPSDAPNISNNASTNIFRLGKDNFSSQVVNVCSNNFVSTGHISMHKFLIVQLSSSARYVG